MLPVANSNGGGGGVQAGWGLGRAVVGQGFVPGFPLQVKIILISCTFWEFFPKSYVRLAVWKIDVPL